MKKIITDPYKYKKYIKNLEIIGQPIQYDRVFEITVNNYPENLESIQYQPCFVYLVNADKKNISIILDTLTMELEYELSMKLNDYHPVYLDSINAVQWVNTQSQDTLMLSPTQPKKFEWDVSDLNKDVYSIGSSELIPYLANDVINPSIKLKKWRHVYIVDNENDDLTLSILLQSKKEEHYFIVPKECYLLVHKKYPIKKIKKIGNDVIVQGSTDLNEEWVRSCCHSFVPYIWMSIPINDRYDDTVLQYNLIRAASSILPKKVLPIVCIDLRLIKVYSDSSDSINEFLEAFDNLPDQDLSSTDTYEESHVHVIIKSNYEWVNYYFIIQSIPEIPRREGSLTKMKDFDTYEKQWRKLQAYYKWIGVV
jgi:hypothetical protein